MKILGFAGRKRSGKDTLCDAIAEVEEHHRKFAIASSLKQLCCDLLGVDMDTLIALKDGNGPKFDMPTPDSRWCDLIASRTHIDAESVRSVFDEVRPTDVRSMLQILGTDIIRRYNPDWHIDETIKDIMSCPADTVCLVSDVRFPNEVRKLKERGADIYFVVRPRCLDVSNHPSEIALGWREFDHKHIIVNDVPLATFISAMQTAYSQSDLESLTTTYANWRQGSGCDIYDPLVVESLKRYWR